MPKAIEDFIDKETYRAAKNLSFAEFNRYLFSIYSAGYAAGVNDAGGEKFREAAKKLADSVEAALAKTKEKAEGAP